MEKTLREATLPKHFKTSHSTQYLPHNVVDEPRGTEPAQDLTSRQCMQRDEPGGFAEWPEARRQWRNEDQGLSQTNLNNSAWLGEAHVTLLIMDMQWVGTLQFHDKDHQ